MSLLKKITKTAGKVLKKAAPVASFLPGPIGAVAKIGTAIGGIGAGVTAARSLMPVSAGVGSAIGRALPSLPRVIPGAGAIGGAVRAAAPKVGRALGAAATGYAIYDAAGNFLGYRKKPRRINPMNHRALNRAIRRVCAAKKISKKIEKLTGGGSRRSSVRCAPKSKRC